MVFAYLRKNIDSITVGKLNWVYEYGGKPYSEWFRASRNVEGIN